MHKEREQLCPLWLSAVIGLGVVLALAAAFPRNDMQARSLSSQPPSELSIAYLEAWLRAKPDSPEYLDSLAIQYLKLGRWDAAWGVAQTLGRLGNDEPAQKRALWLKVEAAEQMAYEPPVEDARRAVGLQRFTHVLEQTLQHEWDAAQMSAFAEKARLAGAGDIMAGFYEKLAAVDTSHASDWQAKLAEAALAHQKYEAAAQAYFAAYDTALLLDDKRQYFLAALNVLESGNMVARACDEGEKRVGDLIQDPQTLRYLLNLARQANRTDLATRYARALIKLAFMSPGAQGRGGINQVSVNIPAVAAVIPSYSGYAIPRHFAYAGKDNRAHPIAAAANLKSAESQQQADAQFELIFKAFVESNELDDAAMVARKALDAHLDPLVWTRRLAEVALWNNQPREALKYWLLVAQESNDPLAWDKVLGLAPEFDDDQAYLTAWHKVGTDKPANEEDGSDGRNALIAEYMKLGHWESALRIAGQLNNQGDADTRQRILLLQVAATEQLAYSFPPEDPRRSQSMASFANLVDQTVQYAWSIPKMTWLAQKAQAAGADASRLRFLAKLAVTDTDNTSQWQERLGDAALARQAYSDAAQAYFAAQDAAQALDARRRYFLAALKAYAAGGQVDSASTEGERRAGDLAEDPETLRYLLDLARQANRSDLVARYARALVKYALQSQRSAQYVDYKRPAAFVAPYYPAIASPRGAIPGARYAFYAGGAQARVVTTRSATATQGTPAQRNADFDLAFQAFVESKQLDEAEKLAQSAIDQHLDPLVWTRRLAQVAQWNSHPAKALKYWLLFAQSSGSEEAWANVRKLAPQLDDDAAYLASLKHDAAGSPANLLLLDNVIAAYERLGQPDAAMAYLKSRASGSLRQLMLERYAAVAERSGNDAAALQTYRALQAAHTGNSMYAVHIASLEYQQGNLEEAMAALRQISGKAADRADAASYWRLYGELARLTDNDGEASVAYKHLLATGQADASDLNAMTYFYQGHPIDAGRTAEMEFRKNGSERALQSALLFYTEARAWPRVEALLKSLTPEQQKMFIDSDILLTARAGYYLQIQRWEAALADLRRAVQLPDTSDETKVAYLWALADFGTDGELRSATKALRSSAQLNSDYWGAFAAAELRLDNPARALVYLRQQQTQSADDPLWLMTWADAEEASGHAGDAWTIRRKALRIVQQKVAAGELRGTSGSKLRPVDARNRLLRLSNSNQRDLYAAQITLNQVFANGDASKGLLIDLLKQEGRSPEEIAVANSILEDAAGLPLLEETVSGRAKTVSVEGSAKGQAAERQRVIGATATAVALAWAVSGEHNDLARAWMARQYANRLLRPADSEVSLALAANDREALGRVLDRGRGHVPADGRIEALNRTGRISEAETTAFHAAQGAPDNDDLHGTMVQTVLGDRPAMGFDAFSSRSNQLRYTQSSATAGLKLTSRLGLNIEAIQRNQHSADNDELTWVPAHDREFNLTLRDTTLDRDLSLTVGHRNALTSFTTGMFAAEFNRLGPITADIALGINQFTDLSPEMQVGAVKDMFRFGMQWNPESRWFMQGTAEADRFRSQDRTYIGRGFNLSTALGYRIRATQPDWNIRLVAERGIYSDSGNEIPSLGVLLPDGNVPLSSEFMPQNFTQYGVMVGFGTDEKNAYTRAWRPFLDAGYVHDSNQGWGPQVNVGIGGSVLGNDHLRMFYLHEAASQGSGQSRTQFGLSYRLLY